MPRLSDLGLDREFQAITDEPGGIFSAANSSDFLKRQWPPGVLTAGIVPAHDGHLNDPAPLLILLIRPYERAEIPPGVYTASTRPLAALRCFS